MELMSQRPSIIRITLSAGLLYFIMATLAIALTSHGGIATLWPANAVLLALLLSHRQPRWWPILFAGLAANIGANLITRGTLAAAFGYSSLNLLEVLIAALTLGRVAAKASPLEHPKTLARFIVWAGLAAPAVSALGAATIAVLAFDEPFAAAFYTWFIADSLGLLIGTPFILSVFGGEYRLYYRRSSRAERAELIALLALVAAVAAFVFAVAETPLLFLLFPPVMLASFRTGRLGTQAAVLLIALIGSGATFSGWGPIGALVSSPIVQSLHFQLFLAVLLLTCLPISAGLSARMSLAKSLAEGHARLLAQAQELARRASTDPLTGLLNRAGFSQAAERLLGDPSLRPLWLIAIDIDRFKQVNDRYGHLAGDEALRQVAKVLRKTLREEDMLARLGGDEFVALLPARSREEVAVICDRLVTSVRRWSHSSDGSAPPLSISCGAAPAERAMSLEDLLAAADHALYAAKAQGRDCSLLAA
jgi:diguanylate cyclase (GGDEF)-like protein